MRIKLANVFETLPDTILGYRSDGTPIYPIAGGSIDVSSDADDDDGDSDDEDDDSDKEESAWVPPTQEEWEKLKLGKAKSDSEAAARKRFLREAGIDPKTGKAIEKPKVELNLGDDDESDDTETPKADIPKQNGTSKADLDKAQREFQRQLEHQIAKTEQSERTRARSLISAVPNALEDAGWNGRNMNRMLKLLDLDSVHVDGDGEVDGLAEQIAEIKNEFPEFFKRQRMKEAVKEVADTSTVGGGKKKAPDPGPKDWASSIADALSRGGN